MLAFVAWNVRVTVRISEAGAPEGSGRPTPWASEVRVAQVPVVGRGPSRIGGMGEAVVKVVQLIVDVPPSRQAPETEDLELQLKVSTVDLLQGPFAEHLVLCGDKVFADGVGEASGEDRETAEARESLGDGDVAEAGLLSSARTEIVHVGGVKAVACEVLHQLLEQIH